MTKWKCRRPAIYFYFDQHSECEIVCLLGRVRRVANGGGEGPKSTLILVMTHLSDYVTQLRRSLIPSLAERILRIESIGILVFDNRISSTLRFPCEMKIYPTHCISCYQFWVFETVSKSDLITYGVLKPSAFIVSE